MGRTYRREQKRTERIGTKGNEKKEKKSMEYTGMFHTVGVDDPSTYWLGSVAATHPY
jgi:hypothetical protein